MNPLADVFYRNTRFFCWVEEIDFQVFIYQNRSGFLENCWVFEDVSPGHKQNTTHRSFSIMHVFAVENQNAIKNFCF